MAWRLPVGCGKSSRRFRGRGGAEDEDDRTSRIKDGRGWESRQENREEERGGLTFEDRFKGERRCKRSDLEQEEKIHKRSTEYSHPLEMSWLYTFKVYLDVLVPPREVRRSRYVFSLFSFPREMRRESAVIPTTTWMARRHPPGHVDLNLGESPSGPGWLDRVIGTSRGSLDQIAIHDDNVFIRAGGSRERARGTIEFDSLLCLCLVSDMSKVPNSLLSNKEKSDRVTGSDKRPLITPTLGSSVPGSEGEGGARLGSEAKPRGLARSKTRKG